MRGKSYMVVLFFIVGVVFLTVMACAHKSKKEKEELYPTLYKGWAEKMHYRSIPCSESLYAEACNHSELFRDC